MTERVHVEALDTYQKLCRRLAANPGPAELEAVRACIGHSVIAETHLQRYVELCTYGLGIAGEAGEAADLIKKHVGHGHPLNKEKLAKELGDVLWYTAMLADLIGLPLSEIARINIEKLHARYAGGTLTTAESIDRKQGDV